VWRIGFVVNLIEEAEQLIRDHETMKPETKHHESFFDIREARAEIQNLRVIYTESSRDLATANAKLERYRVALAWYADPIAYSLPVQDMNHHVFPDRGAVAREALEDK